MDKKQNRLGRLLLLAALSSALQCIPSQAQDVKGASKVGSGFSSFRQNILSVQQKRLQPQPVQVQSNSQSFSSSSSFQQAPVVSSVSRVVEQQDFSSNQVDSEPAVYGSVDGVPGVDFPAFTTIPNTGFSCEGRPFDPGMYADESTGCQVYHMCYGGRRESFLCGVGTVFNQAILNCDFWHSVDCARSAEYYHLNSEFGKASSEPSSSSFSKQQVSTSFVARPAPVSKTVSREQVSQTVRVQAPASTRLVESSRLESSAFSRPLVVSGGKTSRRREEQSFSSSGFISPGQQLQLSRFQSANDAAEFAQQAGSETSKVISKTGLPLGKTSIEQELSSKRARAKSSGTKQSVAFKPVSKLEDTQQQTDDGGNEWKVYFRNKASGQVTSRRPSGPRGSTGAPSTTTAAPSTAAQPLATEASPDQEPSFSGEGPKEASAPSPKSSPPPSTEPANSIESDVSEGITATSPAPQPSSTQPAGGSEGAATTSSQQSTTDRAEDSATATATTTRGPPSDQTTMAPTTRDPTTTTAGSSVTYEKETTEGAS